MEELQSIDTKTLKAILYAIIDRSVLIVGTKLKQRTHRHIVKCAEQKWRVSNEKRRQNTEHDR